MQCLFKNGLQQESVSFFLLLLHIGLLINNTANLFSH